MSRQGNDQGSLGVVGHPGLGLRLRALRAARGYSLATVAQETDISTSFLSLVESERSDITLRRLLRLAEFYDVSLADLIDGEGERVSDEILVVRANHRQHVRSPEEGLDVDYLVPAGVMRSMLPMLFTLERGGATIDRASHAGEEFAFVLSGTLCLEIDDSEPLLLASGEGAYFLGTRPHSYRNAGRGTLRFMAVISPGSFHVEQSPGDR